jgi:hypothetical protein
MKNKISKKELEQIQPAIDCINEHIKNATDEYNKKNKKARDVEATHLNPKFKKKKPV